MIRIAASRRSALIAHGDLAPRWRWILAISRGAGRLRPRAALRPDASAAWRTDAAWLVAAAVNWRSSPAAADVVPSRLSTRIVLSLPDGQGAAAVGPSDRRLPQRLALARQATRAAGPSARHRRGELTRHALRSRLATAAADCSSATPRRCSGLGDACTTPRAPCSRSEAAAAEPAAAQQPLPRPCYRQRRPPGARVGARWPASPRRPGRRIGDTLARPAAQRGATR